MVLKLICIWFVLCYCNIFCEENHLELKQVLILSRHGIRAPLENVSRTTPKKWPQWDVGHGNLTAKGAMLEEAMGEYFKLWLTSKNFTFNSTYAYSSSLSRTIDSAKAFTKKIQPNIKVKFDPKLLDNPVFIPLVNNDTEYYKDSIIENMRRKLENAKLNDAFVMLNEILDIEKSDVCLEDGLCDLTNVSYEFDYNYGKQPYFIGAMKIASAVVDAFLMEYYEGMSLDNVAWGLIKTDSMWQNLVRIVNENVNIRINNSDLYKQAVKPLAKLMYDLLERKRTKFSVLYGHDSTLTMLLSALGVMNSKLPKQYEITPIGGKLVFIKWRDRREKKEFLEINYVYQSMEQLREGNKLTLENGPLSIKLQLENCSFKTKEKFCPWKDFVEILEKTIN